jgi:hypothetical protein
MKRPKLAHNHVCCPKEWRETPDITGNHELDASIMRNGNRDMADRLELYTEANIYGYKTGYGGYHGYHGDD